MPRPIEVVFNEFLAENVVIRNIEALVNVAIAIIPGTFGNPQDTFLHTKKK